MKYEVPTRTEADGPVGVHAMVETRTPHGDAGFEIEVTHMGERQTIRATRYNAARALVMLCLMLEVPCPKALAKMPM